MTERRFQGPFGRLRSPERLARLEVGWVAERLAGDLTRPRVLDVGTGTGVFAEAFQPYGEVVGADVNAAMLEAARELLPEITFVQAEAERLPFPDHSFDLVFLGHVLHEATDPVQALRESRRVGRGRVGVLEWPFREEPQGPPLAHRLRPETVRTLAAEAGFSAVREEPLTSMVLYVLEG
ncbi:class I SAM-dependent methyltransferase [Deinococcus aluminii]|uniref:2-methoxy-6-polyprenyl-1,4-benzoquinol methylase, mitochondrial n=1 Tax=Deinococcus aluminii TaxID=1656885 RepID=A0ABP9XHL4_9DEIO